MVIWRHFVERGYEDQRWHLLKAFSWAPFSSNSNCLCSINSGKVWKCIDIEWIIWNQFWPNLFVRNTVTTGFYAFHFTRTFKVCLWPPRLFSERPFSERSFSDCTFLDLYTFPDQCIELYTYLNHRDIGFPEIYISSFPSFSSSSFSSCVCLLGELHKVRPVRICLWTGRGMCITLCIGQIMDVRRMPIQKIQLVPAYEISIDGCRAVVCIN